MFEGIRRNVSRYFSDAEAKEIAYHGAIAEARLCIGVNAARSASLAKADAWLASATRAIPTWAEIFELESAAIPDLPAADLRARVWVIREEMQRLATAELFTQYLKQHPPNPNGTTDLSLIQADVRLILEILVYLRAGKRRIERMRAGLTVLAVILGGGAILFINGHIGDFGNWPLFYSISTAGACGALLSFMSRLYQISVKGDLIDRAQGLWRDFVWIASPFLAMVEGIIAAIAITFILQAHLISSPLIPAFDPHFSTVWQANFNPPLVLSLMSTMDISKLLVFCLLAGFSERLVPDMLTQLATKSTLRELPKG